MPINQLYGEILGNTKNVTWEESKIINTWYELALLGKVVPPALAIKVAYIYGNRTMDYRDHIVQGILGTF